MAQSRAKAKGRRESGSYVAMPHGVLRHPNFANLTPRATKLLMDLCSVYNGRNNGDMATAWSTMKFRGWRSRDQLGKAQQELLAKGFIIKTRQGGRNRCNLFAVTIWAIDDCDGKLEISATNTPKGEWKNSAFVTRAAGYVNTRGGPMRSVERLDQTQLTRIGCQSDLN